MPRSAIFLCSRKNWQTFFAWFKRISILLVPIVVFLTYKPIIRNQFIADDFYLLAFAAKNGLSLNSFFVPIGQHFQPLFRAFFAIEFCFFNIIPTGYYWVNIIIHVANTCLITVFFFRFFRKRSYGLLTGLLFGVSASCWEVPLWITCQGQLLSLFWLMLSIICYWEYLNRPRLSLLVFSSITHLFMLLSFSFGFEVPVLYMLLCVIMHYNARLKNKITGFYAMKIFMPFIANVLLYFILRNIFSSDLPTDTICNALGGKQFIKNIPKSFCFLIGGIYTGYVRSFTGSFIISFTPFSSESHQRMRELIWMGVWIIFLVRFLQWRVIFRKENIMLFSFLFVWLFITYYLPILPRITIGFNFEEFVFASRYRYFPCVPAAALAVFLLTMLRPFSRKTIKSLTPFFLNVIFVFIAYVNIAEIKEIERLVRSSSLGFQKNVSTFVEGINRILKLDNRLIQIIDEPFFDGEISFYAGWNVLPSKIVALYFSASDIARINFVGRKYIHLIDCKKPLYLVKKGGGVILLEKCPPNKKEED